MGCVSAREADAGSSRSDDNGNLHCVHAVFEESLESQLCTGTSGLWNSAEEVMSVLLIFPTDDPLSRRFAKAAERLGLQCDVAALSMATTPDAGEAAPQQAVAAAVAAVNKFASRRHHLVLLDRRDAAQSAADSLLRSLRAIVGTVNTTTFAAVVRTESAKNTHLSDLLHLGYDLKIREELCASPDLCSDELLSIQRNTFRHQRRLGSLAAVLTALGNCTDAVEITDDKFGIQYVNAAHERMFGFASGELVGRSSLETMRAPDGKGEEQVRNLTLCLRRGKAWDGILTARRKSGASVDHYSMVYPVRDWHGSVHHFAWLRRSLTGQLSMERSQQMQQPQVPSPSSMMIAGNQRNSSSSAQTTPNRQAASRRGSAVARVASIAAVEAPINKVISLIDMVQEGCSPAVSAALDKVLEILHQSADLYSGELSAHSQEDKITSDYVGGLMLSGSRLPEKKRQSIVSQRQNSAGSMDTPDHLSPYLEGEAEWDFDILELERVTNRKPMVHLGMRILRRFGVCQFLQCSEDTMLRWLQVIQDHYRADNCYHNASHGADVMQCSAYFLERDRVKAAFDEMDEAASLLGALVHDLDHPGRTNPFLINSQDRLALLYNDASVLESHHVSLAFQLTTKDERINIFKNMSRDDYKILRQNMIDVVLATEMAKHFEHVGKFGNQILAPLLTMEEGEDGAAGQPISEEEAQELLTRPENRALIKRVLIKCSDVSNPCRPLKLCKEWASRISEEYFQQTDEEKSKNLPIVMPVFDRATCNMPKSQVSFIDFFLKEMFMAWHKFCNVPALIDNMNANYAYWKRLIDEQQEGFKTEA